MRNHHQMMGIIGTLAAVALLVTTAGTTLGAPPPKENLTLQQVVGKVTAMPRDGSLQQRLQRLGLRVMNVMWEDTGRSAGSALGPNISDLTLQVVEKNGRRSLLPVIRYPNFTDRTADVPLDQFYVRVGNQVKDDKLETVTLAQVLQELPSYLSDPDSLKGEGDFFAKTDTHALVSAQHVYLPVPAGEKVDFQPVVFNYQSSPGDPAVMVLLVTRQGMSATVVENRGGGRSRGEQLFHNDGGQRALFTAERISDVAQRIDEQGEQGQDVGALDAGADVMLLVQIPLKHKSRGPLPGLVVSKSASAPAPASSIAKRSRAASDIEQAVLGHGQHLGPFQEMRNLELQRDDRFPIRVTVQFYRATSNGVFDDEDILAVQKGIDRVYSEGDYVGSLVVPEGGVRERPTDWILQNPGGDSWQHQWPFFWRRASVSKDE